MLTTKPSHISNILSDEDLLMLLRSGAEKYRCGIYLASLEGVILQPMYHGLETDRLRRKCLDIKKLHDTTKQDWNQVMFIIFMRALSDEDNRQNFMEVAHRVDFKIMLREKTCLENLELILLGTSGLLSRINPTEFVRKQILQAEYLLNKYNIVPLTHRSWVCEKPGAVKLAILRLTQVAQIVFSHDLLFGRMISCKSRDDLFALFSVSASERWCKEFNDSERYRLPRYKCDLIGINLIVPMLYAYGFYTANDATVDIAGDLNESIPAESNRYIRRWREYGLTPQSAFETQALLQLTREYCDRRRCDECCVYRHIRSNKSSLEKVPIFIDHQR